MNRSDLRKLATMRVREAQSLLKSRNYCGAYYLAGYAVECGLKACIARQTSRYDFPDKKRAIEAFEHSPEKLVKVADLQNELDSELKSDPVFAQYWTLIKIWKVESRYETTMPRAEAARLIDALNDPDHGVIQWLQKYW